MKILKSQVFWQDKGLKGREIEENERIVNGRDWKYGKAVENIENSFTVNQTREIAGKKMVCIKKGKEF